MEWKITYYDEGVMAAIDGWPVGVRAVYARVTERMVLFGPNLGMPFTRSMGTGLFEIRARGRDGHGRALFCTVVGQEIIILHAFIKKTKKTPRKELDTARARMAEVQRESS